MTDPSIKLTVVVPVYNTAKYLHRCMKSLLNQEFSTDEYEILVINDGSTDNSEEILMSYAAIYPNIRVIHQENSGVAMARNHGLMEAKGEFVCFVDSDDYVVYNGLSFVYSHYVNPDVDLIRYYVKFVYDSDMNIAEMVLSNSEVTFQGCGISFLKKNGCDTFSYGFFYRRSYLENLHLSFQHYVLGEDLFFVTWTLLTNPRVISTTASIYRYCIRSNSATTKRLSEHCRRGIGDLVETSCLLMEHSKSMNDDVLYKMMRQSLSRRMSMIFSRSFSANYNMVEYVEMLKKCERIDLLPLQYPTHSFSDFVFKCAQNLMYYIPWMYIPLSFFYRYFFLPYIQPHISRE